MIERNGDMFTTSAGYIGHGANCRGVMGAGVARTLKDRFPTNYTEYHQNCMGGHARPGGFFVVPERDPKTKRKVNIVNLYTQMDPGANATYPAVFTSLYNFAVMAADEKKLKQYGGIIAVPEIGCGIGGLQWPVVKRLMRAVEKAVPEIEFEVWHYKP